MRPITTDRTEALIGVASTRTRERAAAAGLPAGELMRRAGLCAARLARAVAPHAQRVWVACGPGNNGGDGLQMAAILARQGLQVAVSWLGQPERQSPEAGAALNDATAAGVTLGDPPADYDLAVDALLGIGAAREPDGTMAQWIARLGQGPAPVLSLDLPSGLNADTGQPFGSSCVRARWTLSLLDLKPGLFTAQGRDFAGRVWFDDLGVTPPDEPEAWLLGADRAGTTARRPHASHKGDFGDVAVVGGAPGMTGAPLLAARAALSAGAGRVFVVMLDSALNMTVDPIQPALMFRSLEALDLSRTTVVCGCGAGDRAAAVLPVLLSRAPRLVLDADALNAVARDSALEVLVKARSARGRQTVLTPHPLEAARLLGCDTAQVQSDRLGAARTLAERFACTVVVKGSGSVIAAPGQPTAVNHSGNARLATAGTGDVLAGMVGAQLAADPTSSFDAACRAVYRHGRLADDWSSPVLTAELLAQVAGRACS